MFEGKVNAALKLLDNSNIGGLLQLSTETLKELLLFFYLFRKEKFTKPKRTILAIKNLISEEVLHIKLTKINNNLIKRKIIL